jgi:hypothetical protein
MTLPVWISMSVFAQRVVAEVNGIPVNFISLPDLKANKKAAGRNKDLADLDYLP